MANLRRSVHMRGVEQFIQNAKRLGAKYIQAAGKGLRLEGETVTTEAKRQTPVLTGALRSSGHVVGPSVGGRDSKGRFAANTLLVTISFGGPAGSDGPGGVFVGYAIYVHEDLTAHHAVGNAKFLEIPLKAAKPGMVERIAAEIRREGF